MFNIRVTYGSDIDKAIELMRGVAAEMRQDPHFRYLLLDDLEVMGLDQFTDTALVLMARLRTPPGKQWTVSREFNRRLKAAFDAHGIDFPNPQRAIRVLGDTLAGARPAGDAGDGT
jgi:small conductance mechanosensitive channel